MGIVIKIIVTSVIIVSISEIAKRVSWIAAILASLPLTSILAMVWLYVDTKDVEKVITLSNDIFWAVLPSLLFFIVLPAALKMGISFPAAMAMAIVAMFLGYTAYVFLLSHFGIKI